MEVPMRRFWADTVTAVTFSTVVAMAIEILIAGLTFGQSLQTRLVAIIPTVVAARPYGLFRDWVMRTSGAKWWVTRALADIFAFTCFQVPIYAANLALSGATRPQIFAACTTLAIISGFVGWPYGLCLEFSRRKFRA